MSIRAPLGGGLWQVRSLCSMLVYQNPPQGGSSRFLTMNSCSSPPEGGSDTPTCYIDFGPTIAPLRGAPIDINNPKS